MKSFFKAIILMTAIVLMLASCSTGEAEKPSEKQAAGQPSEVQTPIPEITENSNEPESATELKKVSLTNGADSVGNYNSSFSQNDFNLTYDNEHVIMINWQTMYYHGEVVTLLPVKDMQFSQKAVEPKYHDGQIYYLVADGYTSDYYLYSWDFKNPPVKVIEQKVYTFIILDDALFFTEEFVQGPLFRLNLQDSSVTRITENRVHNFTSDNEDIYYKSTDVGNAPGLVKYDVSTGEESLVIFPFYSSNYIVLNGYAYFEEDAGGKLNVVRQSLKDQSFSTIRTFDEYMLTINISDGELYMLTENNLSTCHLDGTGVKVIHEGSDFKRGMFIIGDRIYFSDYNSRILMIKKNGSDYVELTFED